MIYQWRHTKKGNQIYPNFPDMKGLGLWEKLSWKKTWDYEINILKLKRVRKELV